MTTATTLLERKRRLREIVPAAPSPSPSPLLYADPVVATGVDLFEAVCRNGLSGIVANRADGRYAPEEPTGVKIEKRNYGRVEGWREWFEKRRATAGYSNCFKAKSGPL